MSVDICSSSVLVVNRAARVAGFRKSILALSLYEAGTCQPPSQSGAHRLILLRSSCGDDKDLAVCLVEYSLGHKASINTKTECSA